MISSFALISGVFSSHTQFYSFVPQAKTTSLFLPAEAVSNVAITSSLPEAIELNSTVVLNCSAKGSFLKFTWTNGTAPIVADGTRLTVKEVRFKL